MSDDLNAKREFNTTPEITLTPSILSEADPQRGYKAESRFDSGAEASTSALKDANLFDKGRLCPHAHFFSGDLEEYQNFYREYDIRADMMLNQVRSD